MNITLIGMSNIGKSYWSRRVVHECGFAHVDCDAMIESKLAMELKQHGYRGLEDMGRWMGQPYEPHYADTSRKYLACEQAAMEEAVLLLQNGDNARDHIIDTSGSFIYTSPEVRAALKKLTRMIYLEASSQHIAKLFASYLAKPKPVIWGGTFHQHTGETPEEALKRCYPEMLAYRAERYRQLADIIIPYEEHHLPEFDPRIVLHLTD